MSLVYLCSPNNPTGNVLEPAALEAVIRRLDGRAIVVLDEAYVEWSAHPSRVPWLERFETLVILRTLSKAHALAGARIGALLARPELIEVVRRVVMPYSLATPAIAAAVRALEASDAPSLAARVAAMRAERERLRERLAHSPLVERVHPSDANFLLLECRDADAVLTRARAAGILLRDLRRPGALERAVRVTVGSPEDNARLLAALESSAAPAPAPAGTLFAPARSEPAPAEEDFAGSVPSQRHARRERSTAETTVSVAVDLEREAPSRIDSGIAFFDHMLEQLARHAGIALELQCRGDLEVDEHHSVEDCALTLGDALRAALGDKRGIARYGFLLPMDEARAQVALDLSGRAYFRWRGQLTRERVGDLPTELVPHFFRSFADALGATLHLEVEGENCHHMIEACFKGVGRCLRQAIRREGALVPSTKGVL